MAIPEKPNLSLVHAFDQDDDSFLETVVEYTKLTKVSAMALGERVSRIMADHDILNMMTRSWKPFPGAKVVPLPQFEPPQESFASVVARRRSVSTLKRDFHEGPISLEQLAGTLTMTYGPTTVLKRPDGTKIQEMRATSSGGGIYPTELYVLAFDVEGLESGAYHFHPINNTLEVIRLGDLRSEFIAAATYPGLAKTCAVAVVLTTVFRRTAMKYRNRALRFALLDTGGVCTSLYLAGTAMGVDTCALGGFYDNKVSEIIRTHPVDEPTSLCFLLGRAEEQPR